MGRDILQARMRVFSRLKQSHKQEAVKLFNSQYGLQRYCGKCLFTMYIIMNILLKVRNSVVWFFKYLIQD